MIFLDSNLSLKHGSLAISAHSVLQIVEKNLAKTAAKLGKLEPPKTPKKIEANTALAAKKFYLAEPRGIEPRFLE